MADQVSTGAGRRSDMLRSYAWLVALAGVLILVGGGIAYLFNHDWALEAEIAAGVGLVLLLVAVLLRPDVVRTALTGRTVKYGSNAAIMSLAFIAILGFINFISVKNNREYDLTETREFTLSEQTIQFVQNIDQPIQVIGFFQANDGRLDLARNYLERYSRYTDHLSYEFHDPNVEPALAQNFELSSYGLVFVSETSHYETAAIDEQTITSGLMRVTSSEPKKIYFMTGHSSYDLNDTAPEGYSKIKHGLERENYLVEEINLSTVTAIPEDAQVLILAGANARLSEAETQLLSNWIETGGKLMLLANPLQPAPLEPVLGAYGLAWGEGFVVDMTDSLVGLTPEGLSQQVTAPLVSHYPYHEITRGLNGFQTFFPFSRAVLVAAEEGMVRQVSALVSTSPNSWIETNEQSTDPEFNEGEDIPGPVDIAAAAEDSDSGARLVLFGNADFVINQNLSPEVANEDLFMNAVNWLAEDEELISIRPKERTSRQVFLTPMQYSLTLFTTLVVIPLAVLSTGIVVWWRRR